jgi:UDP-N-acetylmuramyl pentapeptide phosphotransferase/UDP-N-acetylglucosamine-1-phosphate transferase
VRSILTVLAAFAAAAALTPAILPLLRRSRALAHPNERTMHEGVIPKGGGWAVLAALVGAAAICGWIGPAQAPLLVCLAVLALVSWRNDAVHVAAPLRLGVHLAASAVCVLSLPGDALVFQGLLPFALDRAVAALALAWFVNLYNFMDGIDGIASAETIAISAGYVAVGAVAGSAGGALDGLALAATGAGAGFLVWNRPPAKVFLGDVGSVPLGYLMGWLLLDLTARGQLAAALILPLYFAADASITLARRVASGADPTTPHRTHFYQRAAAGWNSHGAVVVRMSICNLALVAAAMLSVEKPLLAGLVSVVCTGALLLHFAAAGRRGDKPAA